MKIFTLLGLSLALTLSLGSCGKDGKLFKSASDRVMGEWKYEKVKFHEDGRIVKENLTDEFQNIEIELTEDFEFIESNTESGIERTGIWKIDTKSDYYGGNTGQTHNVLSTILTFPGATFLEEVEWEYLCVNRNKISAQQRKDGGTYIFTLVRK